MVSVYCMWQSFQVFTLQHCVSASDVVPVYSSAQVLLILLLRTTTERKSGILTALLLYLFVCLIELLHSFESSVPDTSVAATTTVR